ncbi:proline racemase family protein [Oceanobacillus locisalsi]|uniref:Proline racemase family protein n=1 Tax=Oceanobacillus locisalsi TaxID=546107 RepID=A0ABW3NF87_9BACI
MKIKRSFDAIEVHAGLPMRVVTSGIPTIPGNSVYEQALWLEENDDQLRKLMLREPRGYPPICCNLIVPAKHPDAAAGYIIMEQVEYPMMSGGNTISVATALLESGMIPMQEPVTEFALEAPAGLIPITADCEDGKVTQVYFDNVASYAVHIDAEVEVPTLGKVKVDIAWGGMYYCIIDSTQFDWLELVPEQGKEIARISALCTQAAKEQLDVPEHPDYPGIGITVAEMHGPTDNPDADGKSVNTMFTGEINLNDESTWIGALDRCACGTGTSAMMAVKYAKGELTVGDKWRNEGLIGIIFEGKVTDTSKVGEMDAVHLKVGGQAWIYGFTKYILDETDPFSEGYRVGDIW